MPDWSETLKEIKEAGSAHDMIRREYLMRLFKLTGRNIILYYSGWLQKRNIPGVEVSDADKNGFMTVIHKLDCSKGLDLILHTPGGETAATESLVDYLREKFDWNMRAFVPQLALSAGTMMACACKEIIMGKQSSLGPVDPQFRGLPAHGVIEEFKVAHKEIKKDASKIPIWQPILAKYTPALLGECEKAIDWADEMVRDWLKSGMFNDLEDSEKEEKVGKIIEELGDHALSKSHARHLSFRKCKEMGLKVKSLEENQKLQDAVLSVHHACIHTLSSTGAIKLIENHEGRAFIQSVNVKQK